MYRESTEGQITKRQTILFSSFDLSLFFLLSTRLPDRPQDKKSEKVLRELENIDDEADQLGIAFVKIADEELAEEYSLSSLPTLVYYRNNIPVIFEGKRDKKNAQYFDLSNIFICLTFRSACN